jgi:cytochrome oxidase Cu insertion factor (SCO1/SenC/PrrC family)
MKKTIIAASCILGVFTLLSVMAFTSNKTATKKYMQFTTVESVVPGGLGRSRIITTDETGSKIEEIDLKNFYSLVGINFGNIRNNDEVITKQITDITAKGWKLEHITTGVESGVDKTGLFVTRYLFSKEE